jgi:hypothetical protein
MVAAYASGGLPTPVAARSAAFHHGEAGAELNAVRVVTAPALIQALSNRRSV